MKTAVKVLVIIAGVVGIIWSIVGFFSILFGGAFIAAGQETIGKDAVAAKQTASTSVSLMLKMIGSLVVVVAGLVFGIISSSKEIKPIPGIILAALLLGSGILATIWASYVAGPIYLLCGLLAIIANAISKGKATRE